MSTTTNNLSRSNRKHVCSTVSARCNLHTSCSTARAAGVTSDRKWRHTVGSMTSMCAHVHDDESLRCDPRTRTHLQRDDVKTLDQVMVTCCRLQKWTNVDWAIFLWVVGTSDNRGRGCSCCSSGKVAGGANTAASWCPRNFRSYVLCKSGPPPEWRHRVESSRDLKKY